MKRSIAVHTGEVMAGQGEVVLKSDTNNACMVIVAYDSVHKIGGLAHAMFADGKESHHCASILRDSAEAIDEMVKDMALLGADKGSIEVALVAGENVSHTDKDPVYRRNVESARDMLNQKHLKCSDDFADDVGMGHVSFDVQSGSLFCS